VTACPNAPGCSDPDWCEQCGSCRIARSNASAPANVPRVGSRQGASPNAWWLREPFPTRTPPPVKRPPPEPPHELQYAVDEHGKLTTEYVEVEQTLLSELEEWTCTDSR
jgi:hypothetical protein